MRIPHINKATLIKICIANMLISKETNGVHTLMIKYVH
jgi:hypothetical protein